MRVSPRLPRRRFLQIAASSAAGLVINANSAETTSKDAFSFVLLGDLHFDRLEHHDMAWLDKNKAGDLSQIKNYSRITADITPKLFTTVRETVDETQAAFVLQVGDLVEGLCGNEELAARQNQEALAFVREAKLGVPFVFTKGNHDVTGDGAVEAFKHVCHPFMSEQAARFVGGGELSSANYTIEHAGALFCFFDAYNSQSIEWLEAVLTKRHTRHCFVVIHPPVVPYGARSTWHLYSAERDKARREKLLSMLGKQNAFVLGGHIHKFNTLCRTTSGGGKFVQLAVSSIINGVDVSSKNDLSGIDAYTGDQIRVEPSYSPATEDQRRAVYEAEKPFVREFEYADLPGYATVSINADQVSAQIFSGVSRRVWKTVDLSKIMSAGG